MLHRIKQIPPIKVFRRKRYHKHFLSSGGYTRTWGVFHSFAEARAAAPARLGFNQPVFANAYDDRLEKVFTYDYPIIYWLDRIFRSTSQPRVLDVGGHVGVHFFVYQKYLDFPVDLSWQVAEVPEIVAVGRKKADKMGESRLGFQSSFDNLDDFPVDMILSEGTLQYIEEPLLWEVLANAAKPPKHILLNKLTLFAGDDFVMLQNIGGGSFSPVYVWNRRSFIARFEALGYELVDFWRVHERSNYLFDDPERSFSSYSGLYLRRD